SLARESRSTEVQARRTPCWASRSSSVSVLPVRAGGCSRAGRRARRKSHDYGFPGFEPAATVATMPATTTTRKGVRLTTETTIDTSALPDYAPIPRAALGPALNEQGYY